jgi:hypothetical protein
MRFGMNNVKPVQIPLASHFNLSSGLCNTSDKENDYMSHVPYSNAVGSLMYAMVSTRLDISHAVGVVNRYIENPGKDHWEVVKWVIRYLRGTINYSNTYDGSRDSVCGYVDSDFAGDLEKIRSTLGYVFTLAGRPISWMSKIQNIVSLSAMEEEYMDASHAFKEAIWLQGLLGEFGRMQDKVKVFFDSQSVIHLDRNPSYHSKMKHIYVKYHFLRHVVEEDGVSLEKVHTKVNFADMFTKPVLL